MMNTASVLTLVIKIFVVYGVITRTPRGDIAGLTDEDVDIYLGIQYGEIVERWSTASLPKSWNGIKNATTYGPICLQFGPYTPPFHYNESEHCLYLNIWIPRKNASNLLPVRLWLHGGGYTAGGSNDYDARNLSRISNSIVVTMNYRLGIFGYFPLPNVETRNLGWIDQQLALQWIQENIESFGGNKSNVLLFGQSAGGGSVLAHIITRSSWSYYSSAIFQSAGPFRYANCTDAEKVNWALLQTSFPECRTNLTCYRQLNADLFYKKMTLNWVTLWPCVGERSQLREQPITLIRKGEFNKNIPILSGFNFNEGQSSVLTFNHFEMFINETQYRPLARDYLIPDQLIDLYDPTTTDRDYFGALTWLFNDFYIQCPCFYLYNHLSTQSSNIYAYFFLHATENWPFAQFHFNATHLTEIPFVFQSDFAATQLTSAEVNISLKFIDYFTKFHLNQSPWTSYQINESVLIVDLTNDGNMKLQTGFGQRLIDKCPVALKYFDSGDCRAYLTEHECLTIENCHWTGHQCEPLKTSFANYPNCNSFLLFPLIFLNILRPI